MIKKVLVTLLVTVDTEVEEIITSHLSDYVAHTKRVQMRIDDLYNG